MTFDETYLCQPIVISRQAIKIINKIWRRMTNMYSTISGWMIPFSRAGEAKDIDVSVAMKVCNIDEKVLKDQESPIAVFVR